jgi:hypothetical protein
VQLHALAADDRVAPPLLPLAPPPPALEPPIG